MPRFAANVTTMFREVPFLDRFAAAAKAGFTAVEMQFPYEHEAHEVARRARAAGVEIVLFNLAPGDWSKGDRGLAAIPGREEEFRASVEQGIRYAAAMGAPKAHIMAGVASQGASRDTYVKNLAWAAGQFAPLGLTAVIEAINRHDMPGYLVNLQADTAGVVEEIGAPNLRMQMDCYHMGMMQEDVAARLRQYRALCGHVQIAGVPGRHEPDTGDMDYRPIFAALDEIGYPGWVGCEYNPVGETVAGLKWL